MAAPNVDLVIVFRGASQSTVKAKIRADAKGAEDQYTRLLSTLKQGGLYATGRRGANPGQILVFISCPNSRLVSLVGRERYVRSRPP
jgi:anoctamin-10